MAKVEPRNRPKSPDRPRSEASEVDKTGRRSPISLLWGPKMEASEATLDPFRTVSAGSWVSETHPATMSGTHSGTKLGRMEARRRSSAFGSRWLTGRHFG